MSIRLAIRSCTEVPQQQSQLGTVSDLSIECCVVYPITNLDHAEVVDDRQEPLE